MRELRQANTEKGWDKYMKKITGVWIIGILALIVLAGCGQREQGKEDGCGTETRLWLPQII